MNEKIKLEITCSLCLEVFKDPVILNCCHNFCLGCATSLLTYSGGLTIRCPLCRSISQIGTANGIPQFKKNLTLCNLIDKLTEKSESKSKHCDNCIEERAVVTCKDCGEDLCSLCTTTIHARGRRRAHRVVQLGTVASYKCEIHHREMDFLCLQDQILICVDCLTKGSHNSHQAVAIQQTMKKSFLLRTEKKVDATSDVISPLFEKSFIRSFSSMNPPMHTSPLSAKRNASAQFKPPFLRSRSDDILFGPLRRNRERDDSTDGQGIGGRVKQARMEAKDVKSGHGINIEAKFLLTSSDEKHRIEEKLSVQAFWQNIGEEEVEWSILEKEIIKHFNEHALRNAKSHRSLSKEDMKAIRSQLEEGKRGKISFNAVQKRWHWFTTLEKVVQKIGYVWWEEDPRLCQGIVSRSTSEQMLHGQPKGTFILRFSESQAGFIAVDYVHSRRGVVHTLIDANGLRFKSFERVNEQNVEREYTTLPELIMSLSFFRYVYPNINKQEVFTRS